MSIFDAVAFRFRGSSLLFLAVLFVQCGGIIVKEERAHISGEDGTSLYNRAMALYNQGRFAAAGEVLDRLILGDPHCAEAYFLDGLCCFHLGRYDASIEYFDKGLSLDPDYLPGYLGLGISLYFNGDLVEAKCVLEEGLSRIDNDEERESWRRTLRARLPDFDI